jgi:hypothetical protein
MGGMGEGQSKNPPTQIFKRGLNGDYNVKLTPGKLRTFCEIDWPAFGVGWVSKGSLHKVIVNKVFIAVTGELTAGRMQSSVSPHD